MNKFPHTSFFWKGLDGSQVLTHFCPADTYTAQASVKDIVFSVANNKDKLYSNKSLLLYGNGDGGGGPLKEMLERIQRYGKVAGFPASVEHGDPTRFYEQLEKTSENLNTWKGELYFELHRGTYTSHALIKKNNRKCEFLLRQVELLYTMAILYKLTIAFPKKELDRMWKLVLLNQFHDVLPGSSIGMVYVDAMRFYQDVTMTCENLIQKVIDTLSRNQYSLNTWCFFNPTSWSKNNTVLKIPYNEAIPFQQVSADKSYGLLYCESIPAFGIQKVTLQSNFKETTLRIETTDQGIVVNNGLLEVSFYSKGRISKLIDLELSRNVISPSDPGNVFRYYEDIPLFWDAWDVEIYHLEKGWDAESGSIHIVEQGPLQVVLEAIHPISTTSTLVQKIIITVNDRLIEFVNELDWNENRKILKVEFPVNISRDTATYETQFGILQRPTHANSSWLDGFT
jgi:alpha-mannosidase